MSGYGTVTNDIHPRLSDAEVMANLRKENAKLRELFNETLIRLVAANEAAGGGFVDARYCELLKSHGIEVGE